jgi:hypothetical protein
MKIDMRVKRLESQKKDSVPPLEGSNKLSFHSAMSFPKFSIQQCERKNIQTGGSTGLTSVAKMSMPD